METNAQNAELHHLMSVSLFKLEKIDDAIASMTKAAELDPASELYPSELEVLQKSKDGTLEQPSDTAE